VLTGGHRLPAKHVIHTVAPIWDSRAGSRDEHKRLLAGCYENALRLARENAIPEIAFPCIGTGIYGWPADLAARIAYGTVADFVGRDGGFTRVVFCCFSAADRERYAALIEAGRS
jgi:O-acetyl-ADP-ribose deacetylase (regulator of RNase III)